MNADVIAVWFREYHILVCIELNGNAVFNTVIANICPWEVLLNSATRGAGRESTSIEKDAEEGIGVGPGISVAVGVIAGEDVAELGTPSADRGSCVTGWRDKAGDDVRSAVVVTSPVQARAIASSPVIARKSVRFIYPGSLCGLSLHHHIACFGATTCSQFTLTLH